MKKKFLAMYALVGAMVASPIFTSCIDGEESASVTAVRNAKAEQIKNATAIDKAKAEYDAKLKEVELALKQIEVESDQIDLNDKKARIELNKLQIEQATVQAKYYIAQYTKNLYDYEDLILTELTGNYTTALEDVIKYKRDIYDSNTKIAALEEGIVSIDEQIATDTKTYNDNITAAEAMIEIWKDAEAGVNKEEINAEIATLSEVSYKMDAELAVLQNKYNESNTVLAKTKLDGLNGTISVDGTSYTLDFVTLDENDYDVLNQKAVTVYNQYIAEKLATTEDDITDYEKDLALAVAKLGTEADKKDTKYVSGTDANLADILSPTLYAELAAAKEDLAAKEKTYNEKKEAYEKAKAEKAEKANALTKAKDDLAEEQAKTTPDATKVQTLTEAVTAAQTAYDTANTAFGTAETAYLPTVQPYEDAVALIGKKEIAIAEGKDNINTNKVNLATAKEDLNNFEEFATWVAAFEGEDYEAYKEAKDALAAKETEKQEHDAEIAALRKLLNQNIDVEALIAEQENLIEGWKEDLAKLEYIKISINESIQTSANGSAYGNSFTKAEMEALIAIYEEQIASLEVKIEMAEKRAEQAKAALDAYLATDEEGGEAEA